METASCFKPCVCSYTQPEQRGIAEKIDRLGLGTKFKNRKDMMGALVRLEENYDFYKARAEVYGRKVNSTNGVRKSVEIIQETLEV